LQDIVSILIVILAAVFLARRAWQRIAARRGGSCGACLSCPSGDSKESSPLITIAPIISHAKAQRREELK
jgi:hypothetical protein